MKLRRLSANMRPCLSGADQTADFISVRKQATHTSQCVKAFVAGRTRRHIPAPVSAFAYRRVAHDTSFFLPRARLSLPSLPPVLMAGGFLS
jgi:hypothetical protein